ncbi:hypothetical protein [Oxynema sp. CENA135]|nr:hypothetical protein [Oxynema sp. CENA135]
MYFVKHCRQSEWRDRRAACILGIFPIDRAREHFSPRLAIVQRFF